MFAKTLSAVALLAGLGLAGAADDPPKTKLTPFESKEGKFKISVPVEMKATDKKPGSGPGVTTYVAQVEGGKVFAVTYFDAPADIPADQTKTLFDQFTKGLKGDKGKVLSEKDEEFGKEKYPSRAAVIETPMGSIRQQTVIAGKRVYAVMAIGPKEFVSGKEADKVFESFEITK